MISALPRRPTPLLVRVVLASLVILVWWYAAKAQDPARSDATADWILVKATSSDLSPFADLRTLGDKLGVPYKPFLDETTSDVIRNYRTPGGLLVLYPLVLFDWTMAHLVVGVVGLLSFLWMLLVLVPRYCQAGIEKLLIPLALASISAAFIEATFWGSVSAIVAALTCASILKPNHGSSGIPLATATVMKLYPGLLFVPLLVRRHGRPALLVGLATVLTSTGVGAVAFHLSVFETVRLLVAGSSAWLQFSGNTSFAAVLTGVSAPSWIFPLVAVIGVVIVGIFARRRPLAQAMALAIPMSVLVSPVSWVHYDVVLIPLVLWLWTRSDYPFARFTAIAWLVVEAIASTLADRGSVGIARGGIVVVRILVAVAIALAPARLWEPTQTEPVPELAG